MSVAPSAGTIIQEAQPVKPVVPASTESELNVEPEESSTKLPESPPFKVNAIRITGNTVFDTEVLNTLTMDAIGRDMALPELGKLAARITGYYRRHGYLLARAIVPAQTIRDGQVNIEIIEAHYGMVTLDNHSKVQETLLKATLSPLQNGQAIEQGQLDKVLLLLSDIPGVSIDATLKPGESAGMSNLAVNAAPDGATFTGNVTADNYGNRYTGRNRIGGSVELIGPLNRGDILSLNGLTSGDGMNYATLSYAVLLNGPGTRMGATYSALRYTLNDPTLTSLDAKGSAQVSGLWIKHPLMRGRDTNLYGELRYERKKLNDHIDAVGQRTDRHLNDWTAALSGDWRDTLLATGAANAWYAGWTSGKVGFDDAAAELADAAAAKTRGSFSKYNLSYTRLQNLGRKSALYLSCSGQWARTNLDPSEKMILGGPYTVRAYEMGAVSGDAGQLLTGEFRYDMGQAGHGKLQLLAFVDGGKVTINQNTWVAGENSAFLKGAGLGFNWGGDSASDANQWKVKASIAVRIGSAAVLLANDAKTRAWISIGKGF